MSSKSDAPLGRPGMTQRVSQRAQALFDRHYERHSRYGGDEHPKNAAANARRVASSLRRAITDFSALMDPQSLRTLQSAAEVMTSLGSDLDVASRLARSNKEAQAAKDVKDRHELADRVATERWGGDDALMLAEARELAMFVDAPDALDVREWLLARQPDCKYLSYPTEVAGRSRLYDMLNRRREGSNPPEMIVVRRRAAEYVHLLQQQGAGNLRRYQDIWDVGLDDFEAWRNWRRAIADSIAPARNAST